jgi:glutaconate CoA-transferase subunit A
MIGLGQDKRMPLAEAIRRFVQDGDRVYLGGFVHGEPYAAGHEIIRQGKRDLTLSTAAGTILADQLIGAGCVGRLITSYCWNPLPATAHAFRRAVERGIPRPIELEEYSFLGLSLAYLAGALDLPFVATRTMLGTDLVKHRGFLGEAKLKVVDSPFGDGKVCLIGPLKHDVGIVQLQRADLFGNAQAWGLLAATKYGLGSCRQVIVCVEELVEPEVIRQDPNRTILPGFRVCAVVEEPWGAHPAYVQGYYDRDWRYAAQYAEVTKTEEGFRAFLQEWVVDVKDRQHYLKKLGEVAMARLRGGPASLPQPIPYGRYEDF